MGVEENIKELMIKKSGSVNKFAQACGLPTSTIATMFKRGINNTNINTIIKICSYLQISTDELSNGRIVYLKDIEQPNELNILLESLTTDEREDVKTYIDFLISRRVKNETNLDG